MNNAISIDLEPWMCFFDRVPLRKELDGGALVKAARRLLNLFQTCGARATFFTLGILYEWYPSLLEDIRARGHEIAFHTHSHRELRRPGLLEPEIESSAKFISEYAITGFRAPKMMINPDDLMVLERHNFSYDSSIYAPWAAVATPGKLKEIPVSTFPPKEVEVSFPRTLTTSLKRLEMPIGSGLCVGMFSGKIIDYCIRKINGRGQPAVLFMHPWQLAQSGRLGFCRGESLTAEFMRLPYRAKIQESKLRYILERHRFVTMRELSEES
ncbi:MAG: DUF3473 domain-containing protein [Chloroflexi bacterium]|nr:DUF3473 domain-containing protein [Chloroflexota bacterium]